MDYVEETNLVISNFIRQFSIQKVPFKMDYVSWDFYVICRYNPIHKLYDYIHSYEFEIEGALRIRDYIRE